MMTEKFTPDKINILAGNPKEFLENCTNDYHSRVNEAAKTVFNMANKRIIMLAGPSSSGKTTTAKLLSKSIESLGANAYTVSLDDFYFSRSTGRYPLDENGKPDYETVDALDIELIHKCFGELLGKGRSTLPVFDFTCGERRDGAREIVLTGNDVIIVEGLHALNPVITDNLPDESLFRLYVSVSSRIYSDDSQVLLSKRNLRFIRRMVRDYGFRAMPPYRTFEIWSSVMRGEDRYLFPFEPLADLKLDSFHPCEPCVLAPQAINLLDGVDGEFAKDAAELKDKLSQFTKLDFSSLPSDSLLREFTG